jgi:hypothetical protein
VCVFSITTANCRNWNIDPNYGELVNFMGLVGFTSHDELDGECELILGAIRKIQAHHQGEIGGSVDILVKKVLRVFLINEEHENGEYAFDERQEARIRQIKTTFLRHIHKHFSNDAGNFVGSGDGTGRHSRILKNEGRNGLSGLEIRNILKNIINRGDFCFSINTVPHRLIIVPRGNINEVGAIVNGFSVYRFEGKPGSPFPRTTRRSDMVRDLTTTNFFFQLHFCRIAGDANFGGDGRFGSCYVRAT